MEDIKKFEDFIDRMQGLLDNAKKQGHIIVRVEDLENAFPELKESEDEKIRKVLLNDFKNNCSEYYCEGVNRDMIIAWLEKQGEQKPTDKVEPKFHEGDWVVYECWEETATLQIKNIVDETYEFTDDSTLNVVDEDTLRLWTIQDAKDGDVLCCENGWTCIFKALSNHANTFSSYCFMDSDNWFCNTGSECHTLDKAFIKAYNGEIYPATKEQRELLFQKIHEAGYEWDAEKKELKKIEKNPTDKEMKELLHTEYEKGKADAIAEMQNAWSEEDETVLDNLIYALANDRIGNNRDEYVDWLKSIRQKLSNMERNGKNWKPSDEQIHYLSWIANIKLGDSVVEQEVSKHLNELLEDLKKLMEK